MLHTGIGGHNAIYINEKYEGKLNVQHKYKSIIYPLAVYLAITYYHFSKKKTLNKMTNTKLQSVILIFYKYVFT